MPSALAHCDDNTPVHFSFLVSSLLLLDGGPLSFFWLLPIFRGTAHHRSNLARYYLSMSYPFGMQRMAVPSVAPHAPSLPFPSVGIPQVAAPFPHGESSTCAASNTSKVSTAIVNASAISEWRANEHLSSLAADAASTMQEWNTLGILTRQLEWEAQGLRRELSERTARKRLFRSVHDEPTLISSSSELQRCQMQLNDAHNR